MPAPAGDTPEGSPASGWRAPLAGAVGNALEWYDFALYGYFAPAIGRQFFPADDPTASLLAAFGVFAAGFLARPLGGAFFGRVGDRVGRKQAMLLSVLAMAVPTFLIGLLPGYDRLGPAAPALLVALRVVQGLSVGGEYTTSAIYLVEAAPPGRGGLAGSWAPFGATVGGLLGSASGALVAALLPAEAVASWGWRVPFLAGLVAGVAALAVRRHLPETAAPPPAGAGRADWRTLARLAGASAFLAVGFYLSFVYAVTYLQDVVGLSASAAFDLNTAAMTVFLVVIPLSGALADRVGWQTVLAAAAAGGLALGWPLVWLLHHPDPVPVLAGQAGLAVLVGLASGATPAALAGALPPHARCTGAAVAFNLSMGLLGGFTPLLATALVARTHDDLSPAYLLMAAAAVSLVAVLGLRPAPGGTPSVKSESTAKSL